MKRDVMRGLEIKELSREFEVELPKELRPRTENRAFRGAFWRGVLARLDGLPVEANPYFDHRTWRGSITWSRAFQRYWRDGWEAGARATTTRRVRDGGTEA